MTVPVRWPKAEGSPTLDELKAFHALARHEGDCLVFASTDEQGYGQFMWRERMWRAHRLSLLWAGEVLDPGLVVHHTCYQKACILPAHLRQVTSAENNRDAHRYYGEHPELKAPRGSKIAERRRLSAERWARRLLEEDGDTGA